VSGEPVGNIYYGTSSWTDQTLLKSKAFYPADANRPEQRLRFYAEHFPLVEVDATFYALPSERNAGLWAQRTPDDFVFNVKAYGLMTHHAVATRSLPEPIRDMLPADAAEKTARFVDICDQFGLPVANFVDVPGFVIGTDAERAGTALDKAQTAVSARRDVLETELRQHAAGGEQTAEALRACAHEEAELQGRLKRASEAVTGAEVAAQQVRDSAADTERELNGLAAKLGLEPQPAAEPLPEEEREALNQRVERLIRRREQLGPVNPLAKQEYEEAVAHVEELETQREDLESALAELEGLIKETDRRIREAFEILASSGVDAIVQAGTDLAVADLAEDAERSLRRPVIPINTATYWSSLRRSGIDDRCAGFGSLLAEH